MTRFARLAAIPLFCSGLGMMGSEPEPKKEAGAAKATAPKDAAAKEASTAKSIYDFTVKDIDGKDVKLSKFAGDVCLLVNVASQCGYTDVSYSGMEALNKKYKDKGFKVLAFPANDFGAQEPGSNEEIKAFCSKKGATFDVFGKVSVKGADQCPLYQYLTKHPDSAIAGDVPWNFQKYLIGRDGKVIAKFGPKTPPEDKTIVEQVEKALAAEKPKTPKGG